MVNNNTNQGNQMNPFRITIEKIGTPGIEIIETTVVETLKEARKQIRLLMKKYGLTRYAGHTVNFSTQIELHTNGF